MAAPSTSRPQRRSYRCTGSQLFWALSGVVLIYILFALVFLTALRHSDLLQYPNVVLPEYSPNVIVPKKEDPDYVYQQLRIAGVPERFLQENRLKLPSWSTIVDQFGPKPVILGMPDACTRYQETVAPKDRILAAAGMFSTGTNLVTQLLKHNCYLPARMALYGSNATKEQLGIRWQVPWGKHTPAFYKYQHSATEKAAAIFKEYVFPVVTIRNPWRWMQSMCKNPYSARWNHSTKCPNIMKETTADPKRNGTEERYNTVSVKYGAGVENYLSLPSLWNDWYNEYIRHSLHFSGLKTNVSYPMLFIRMEDLIFHTQSTITAICHCVGGELYSKKFSFIVASAKADSPGHDTSTGMAEAYWKYGQKLSPGADFDPTDYAAAMEILDPHLMELFHYLHPPPLPQSLQVV